jgi:hypothetical protein
MRLFLLEQKCTNGLYGILTSVHQIGYEYKLQEDKAWREQIRNEASNFHICQARVTPNTHIARPYHEFIG